LIIIDNDKTDKFVTEKKSVGPKKKNNHCLPWIRLLLETANPVIRYWKSLYSAWENENDASF